SGGRGRLADRVRLAGGGGEVPAVQHHLGDVQRGHVGGGRRRTHHVERACPLRRVGPGGQGAVELRPVVGGEARGGREVPVDHVLADRLAVRPGFERVGGPDDEVVEQGAHVPFGARGLPSEL